MNDLSTPGNDPTPAKRPDTATYMNLFQDDRTRCAPGALVANNGRLAYLTHLKEKVQAFEMRPTVSAPITLNQRRPDLLALILDEKNSRKVLPKLRIVLDVLESRARQALPEGLTLQQAVANGVYHANVPFHHAWESIKATLATKQLHPWDVLRSTHASYPAFIFDNLTLADQRAATVMSSGFSPQLRALLLAPPLPATPQPVTHLIEENRRQESELEANLHRAAEPEERLHLKAELEACRRRAAELEENQGWEAEFYKHHFHIKDSHPIGSLDTTQKLTKALGLTRRELRKLLAVNAIGEGNTSVTRSAHVIAASAKAPSSQVFSAAFINNGAAPLYLTELTQGAPQPEQEASPEPTPTAPEAPVQTSTPEQTAQPPQSPTQDAAQETTQTSPPAPAQQPAQPPAGKAAKKTVAITGLTTAHLDRLQRILRIQRALDLTAVETDTLVMAALRAEGQAADYRLTDNTLRALGLFRHLQRKYRVTPWQYAAFLDVIAPYAADQQVSFYDQLFAPANSDEDADEKPLQLDDQPFDYQASAGADAQTLNQLAVAMKVNREVLRVVLEWVSKAQGLNKPTRSLAVISACYRIVTLLRLFDRPIAEGMVILALLTQEQPAYLQQLAGKPSLRGTLDTPDIIDVIAGLINTLEWLQDQGLETVQVFALLNHQQPVFQKDWEIAFEADTFKPDPRLSPGPDKQSSDTTPKGEPPTGELEEVPLSAAVPSPKTVGVTKKAPPFTAEQRVEACYKALSQPLRKALKLEASTWVEPLLSWAGVDPEALYQRMLQVQEQLNADIPLREILLLSDLWTWTMLQRYSDLIKLFKLSASALEQIAHQPTWFNLDTPHQATAINEACGDEPLQLDVRILDFTTLYQLGRYKALLARLAKGKSEEGVLAYLKQANGKDAATDAKATWAELEALLGLPASRLSALNLDSPPKTLRDLDRVLRLQALADKHQLSLDTLVDLGKLPLSQDHADFTRVATALRQGRSSKQRKAHEAQLSVAWRDALMQWMLVHWVPGSTAPSWINSPQTLADYLLIDLQVSHEPLTTRTLSATASLQRYLHQIHSHLENGYRDATIGVKEREEWENFSSSYERWELRKSAHNESQNYIDPTRRTRKTTAFKDLENLLAQGKCTPEDVQRALETYLSTFEKLSNIQPISAYADGTSPLTDTYHFIGKTNVEPVEYYWRTLDMSLRDQDGAPSMLAWGEWEKITLGITGKLAVTPLPKEAPLLYVKGNESEKTEADKKKKAEDIKYAEDKRLAEDLRSHIELIRPVIIAGRRYVVWAEWDTTPIAMGKDNRPSEFYPLRICFAFQQTDKTWAPANELLRLDGHGPGKSFDFKQTAPTDSNGSVEGYPSLKSKKYCPGLCVMVNEMGIRQHDPWLTVMLFDAEPAHFLLSSEKTTWMRDVDYFMVAKDLLMIEEKQLDLARSDQYPIENALAKNWIKFFYDARTVQHPYIGPKFKITTTNNPTINWGEDTKSWINLLYENANETQITVESAEHLNNEIRITFNKNIKWKSKIDKILISPFTIHSSSKGAITFAGTYIGKIKYSTENHDCLTETPNPSQKEKLRLLANSNAVITLVEDSSKEYHFIETTCTSHPGKYDLNEIQDDYVDCMAALESGNTYSPLILNEITDDNGNDLTDIPAWSTIKIYKIINTPKNEYAVLQATLTVSIDKLANPNWQLPESERTILNTPELSGLVEFAKEAKNKKALFDFKKSILKTRYTTLSNHNSKIGLASSTKFDSRISISAAIKDAENKKKPNAISDYVKYEETAILEEIGAAPEGVVLEAAIRLRHLEPKAWQRILLYIDPQHELTLEDEIIADGQGKITFEHPFIFETKNFNYKLELYDGSKLLGTLSQTFSIMTQPDDAVPTVQVRHNDQQAFYLDLKEVNDKEKASGQPLPNYLRLNTLFGKQLVRLATQSVEKAISWKAQHQQEPRLEPGSSFSTVDFHSANGLYFWELFFHVPFLVAWLQRQNRDYGGAWRSSTRHLFDPYRTWKPHGNHPPLFWLSKPITPTHGKSAFAATGLTSDPDELAYSNPERYRKALHLFVVENWQRQGDDLYRQLNLDSLVEAALCYDKALRLIGVLPENLSTAPAQAKSLAESTTADFTPPLNNKLIELRNLLRNRLFNLRHGLTLDGKPSAIMLDPDILNQIALGNGGATQDLATVDNVGNVGRGVPPYRYEEVRKCADAAVARLIEMGQALLGFYNTEATQQLELLSKRNLIRLLDFPYQLQEQALELAKQERETVLSSKQLVQQRLDYYQSLVDKGVKNFEETAMNLLEGAYITRACALPFYATASAAALFPKVFGMAFGNANPQEAAESAGNGLEALAEQLETVSESYDRKANYILRNKQWQHEVNQATHELKILDKQLLERDIHIKAARIAMTEVRATQAAHAAEYEVMTSVFASHTTYLWLIGRLSEIYASAYDATLSLCTMAENCLQYELGNFKSTWIKPGAWLDNWRGMLAGEALARDLMLMDVAAIRDNHRPLDIRKDLSLLDCMQWTHEDLHAQLERDEVMFTLSPRLFDQDYPGHYLRRIERISLSFKIDGTSSSDPMPAMLTQYSNKVLLKDDAEGAKHLYAADEGNAGNLLCDLRPHQSAAIWSVKELTRNFDLQPSVPDKTRYQPFEGTGLLSSWKLAFPGGAKNNPVLYRNGEWLLEDINLQISYSAVDGTPEFGAKVKETLARFKASVATQDADYTTRAAVSRASLEAKKDIRKALKKALDTLKAAEAKAKVSADTAQTIRAGTPKAQLDDKTSPASQALGKAETEAARDKTEVDKAKVKVDALRQMEAKAATQALEAAKAKSLENVQKASTIILGARQAIETDGAADIFKTSEGMSRIGVVTNATTVLQTATQTIEHILATIPNEGTLSGVASEAQKATEAVRKVLKAAETVAQARKAAEAEAKRVADAAEVKRKADEADAKPIADEAEAKRKADETDDKPIADEAEAKRKADEADAKRIADEAEAKRKADEADAKRIADEAEAKRKTDEADAKRIADEAEAKRKTDEADAKRIADEAEAKRKTDEADAKRIADEAEAKRKTDEADAKRIADEAEAKRKADETAALIKPAKDAEQQALDDLKTVQADADAAKAVAPKLEGPAYFAQTILKRAQKAANQATAARQNAETAITNNEMDKAAAEVENAKQAAREVHTAVKKAAAARQAAESDKDAVWASATALIGKHVKIHLWGTLKEGIEVFDAEINAVHEKYKTIDYYHPATKSFATALPITDIVKIEG